MKSYWPKLFVLIRTLCKYYLRYQDKMPSDLPNEVKTAMAALTVACGVLAAYDAGKKGGIA